MIAIYLLNVLYNKYEKYVNYNIDKSSKIYNIFL